ncbi:hypothetical protein AB9E31_36195, partial [Rhizobium leguminosarum]
MLVVVADSNSVPAELWANLKERYETKVLVDLVAFAGIMLATAVFNNGVKVIPGNSLDPNTAQTPGMNRATAINNARAGA